jgi:hypothetical protein
MDKKDSVTVKVGGGGKVGLNMAYTFAQKIEVPKEEVEASDLEKDESEKTSCCNREKESSSE